MICLGTIVLFMLLLVAELTPRVDQTNQPPAFIPSWLTVFWLSCTLIINVGLRVKKGNFIQMAFFKAEVEQIHQM